MEILGRGVEMQDSSYKRLTIVSFDELVWSDTTILLTESTEELITEPSTVRGKTHFVHAVEPRNHPTELGHDGVKLD
jgi:hypothetical protein